jgi:hypothetical protein
MVILPNSAFRFPLRFYVKCIWTHVLIQAWLVVNSKEDMFGGQQVVRDQEH